MVIEHTGIMYCQRCTKGRVFPELVLPDLAIIHTCINCGAEHIETGELIMPKDAQKINPHLIPHFTHHKRLD